MPADVALATAPEPEVVAGQLRSSQLPDYIFSQEGCERTTYARDLRKTARPPGLRKRGVVRNGAPALSIKFEPIGKHAECVLPRGEALLP
jgi:hypothetical protein